MVLDSRSVSPRRLLLSVGVLLAAGAATVYVLGHRPVPAVDITDSLTGPTSPFFDIPFDKYTLSPEGLLRAHSASGRSNGIDRPIVRTRSDQYLSRDFVFEVDVTIPPANEDIVFVGFGEAAPAQPYNEPSNVFGLRIHHLPDNHEVRLAAITLPDNGVGPSYVFHELIGTVPESGALTLRLERAGDSIRASVLGQNDRARTLRISEFPSVLKNGRGFLYMANTSEGTTFSNVRVRPRT